MEIQRIKTDSGTILIGQQTESVEYMESRMTLSICEQEYYNSISSLRRRKEWLTSRFMIRCELGDSVSTTYENKRPRLVGSGLFLSISHSDDLVAVYLSDEECGIDIEDYTRDFSRAVSRFLSTEERSFIKEKDIALAWGIKEAAYKKIGVPDIDYASMFAIKKIDRQTGTSILSYHGTDYRFTFIAKEHYNIVY